MEEFELHKKWYDNIYEILDDLNFVRHKNDMIANVASVFDIEASSFYQEDEKKAVMYAWVFGINGKCIRGRTWDEFEQVLNIVADHYQLTTKRRLVVYVHNLAYEFQFIKNRFNWYKNFSLESRKPIYAITTNGIEFRCSYILSSYNLENVGDNLLKYKINKAVGDLDYSKIRHTETPLTDTEWGYILNDGLVVMAYIQEEIERMGNIAKLPITKTGYVRQYCREICLKTRNKYEFNSLRKSLTMTPTEYMQMKRTYMGGFTHANARKVNKVHNNVASYDFTSSYPSVMLSEKFPMSKPMYIQLKNREEFEHYINNYCCMFDIKFFNIEEKVDYEHYISLSRCHDSKNAVTDNGRVIEADEVTISCTEQDYFIIQEMYSWDKMIVFNFCYFYVGYLPKPLIEIVLKLYEDKTTLKGVKEKEVEYQVSKGMLNSMYGMCVTDPCKDESLFDNEQGWITTTCDIETMINKYNKSFGRFLYYAWGLWITAYARFNLFTGIMECKEDYIYADTDSVKILNREKHLKYFEDYNKNITKKIRKCLRFYNIPYSKAKPKTIKGVEKPIGVWDYEGTYDQFKTLGAKRYIYTENGELHLTLAGVGKAKGCKYLMKKYHTINNVFKHFNDKLSFPPEYEYREKGKTFKDTASGKLCHTYIDVHYTGEIKDYLGNVAEYDELSSCHLEATGYELSLEMQYAQYLLGFTEVY